MPLYSQWVQQNSGTSEFLNDVYCISENVVVVVGANGTILKTVDGGAHWIQKASGTNYELFKVQFASANVGYISANNNSTGLLLKTIDGGENWSPVAAAGTSNIYDFSLVNENIVFVTNNQGILRKSTNGGASFNIVNSNVYIQRIQFINEQIGYASNGNFSLVKTIDGGFTWTVIGMVDPYPGDGAFYFVNEQVGFVNTTTSLTRTTDGGQNFTYLDTIEYYVFKLFAPTENIVWGVTWESVIGSESDYTMRCEILNQGGFQRIDGDPAFKSIYFANETIGYAIANEKIYKNTTGTMLSLNNANDNVAFQISPNPASDQIKISLDKNQTQPFSVEIKNCLGEIIFSEFYQEQNFTVINVESLSKGVYFLTIIIEEKRNTQKVIVK